ncbi:aminotransferase class III-fold pyridoxal phosphate-dependent enzyme [Parasedimentitalea huanghaiensis]|uniref:Aminotransferase class III-fold pyridoxal phosphate-dependent enzyme n=1 Tax=Parasedimentitalea huanghaiensis TaxID=2682100 RepID=A0A6L6WHM1_9RHOB|nr:aminotransferase class III-fold pyridoxal phosphate-dependent enzyme [Zongyanglinia huanghaiensis]MVO16459.1 aminotransferase class III-fold pyridoxal phosphate-dependent enzyme [Zongyanglinia huanghaiensis]
MNNKPFPPYMREGKGARIWNVYGSGFIDWQLSFGCLPMGYAHPKIIEMVEEKVARGTRFANTGTEACMTGLRMARGITGKSNVQYGCDPAKTRIPETRTRTLPRL